MRWLGQALVRPERLVVLAEAVGGPLLWARLAASRLHCTAYHLRPRLRRRLHLQGLLQEPRLPPPLKTGWEARAMALAVAMGVPAGAAVLAVVLVPVLP